MKLDKVRWGVVLSGVLILSLGLVTALAQTPLMVYPLDTTLLPGESVVLTASGGAGNYKFVPTEGELETIASNQVRYTPPPYKGVYFVLVLDNEGNPAIPFNGVTATITVTEPRNIDLFSQAIPQ